MTNGQLRAQASALNIPLEKWSLLHSMGVPGSEAKKLAEYSLPLLQLAMELITGTELVLVAELGEHSFGVYLGLRKYLDHDQAISIMDGRHGSEYLTGLDNGVPLAEIERAVDNGIRVVDCVTVYGSDITLDQLIEVKNLNCWPMTYVETRRKGYSHEDLVQLLRFKGKDGSRRGSVDDLDAYVLLRENGTSHAQIIEVMLSDIPRAPYYYTSMRIEEKCPPGQHSKVPYCTEVGHELAMQALKFGDEYSSYISARSRFSHDEINQAVQAGLEISKYVSFRRNHCRITHDEIVQYAQLNTYAERLHGINDYLRLIDDGVTFDQVMGVHLAGGSVINYLGLHGAPLECSHEQILDVARLGDQLGFHSYSQLRQQGITHDDIVAGVAGLNA